MLNIPNPVLQEIYRTGGFDLPSGERVQSNTVGPIDWRYAEALYRAVRQHRPATVLEIGFASGMSSLSILTALAENGPDGRLTSVDGWQTTSFKSAGLHNVARAGFADRHRLLHEVDYTAMPRLLADGETFGLVYIDGSHAFEHVILDAFYADRLLTVGGLMAFNDCGHRPVHAAMKHCPPPDRYQEVDVGLGKEYVGRNALISLERRLTRRSNADRYFRKTS